MKIMKMKRPLSQVREDIRDLYGEEGLNQFDKIKHLNPLCILLDFFPELENAYTKRFKKQLFIEYNTRKAR